MLISDTLVILTAVLSTVGLVWWWLTSSFAMSATFTTPTHTEDAEPRVLLFEDTLLQNATDTALQEFPLEPGHHFWHDLRDGLLARFPDFPDTPGEGGKSQILLQSRDALTPQHIKIEWEESLSWVTMIDAAPTGIDPPLRDELEALRRVTTSTPSPAWEEDRDNKVIWHNDAYAKLYKRSLDTQPNPTRPLITKNAYDTDGRVSLEVLKTGEVHWYKVTPICTNNTTIFHATQITAVVQAEESQHNFVQTLAKTFAHLSSGLAIFNRDRQLVLFNPALVDLTGLPVQFLSAQPDMLSFFDQLREKRAMPEPKNYRSWREEITDVIAAAKDGSYEEIWSLESGQTYSVKGRPHPDGATAFLIEDISAEMSLARSFRAELEQAQVLLDTVEDSIAIFSQAGALTFSNAAFQNLWGITPDTVFADITLHDCAKIWKARAHGCMDISRIDAFVNNNGLSKTRNLRMRLDDDRVFDCDLSPVSSSGVMVRFRQRETDKSQAQTTHHEPAQ